MVEVSCMGELIICIFARQGHILLLEDSPVIRVLLIVMLMKHLFLFQVCL